MISDVFPRGDPPAKEQLSDGDCEDSNWIRQDFYGVEWWKAEDNIIRNNFAQLPFFTPGAFHYYLPAYLLYVLDDLTDDDTVLEYLLYSLRPSERELSMKWLTERKQLFSENERNVLVSFLQRILDQQELDHFHNDTEKALRFWQS
jgi:hypothetical protein